MKRTLPKWKLDCRRRRRWWWNNCWL